MSKGRRYYKIGQVAKKIGVEPYVLRFWETQFPQIKTIRTKGGQRLYPSDTVKTLEIIKHLLYDQGLTIEGARKKLRDTQNWIKKMEFIKEELLQIKELLNK